MTGVDVDQKAYLNNIDPARLKPDRRETLEVSVTEQETSTLRGRWRAVQWQCT